MREYSSSKDGAVKVPAPFKIDGVEFHGAVSFLDIIPLAEFASIEVDAQGNIPPQAAYALVEFFKAALGSDYERFAVHTRKHGTEPLTLLQIMMDLMEDATSGLFPTNPSSSSLGGDGSTGLPSQGEYIELSAAEKDQVRAASMFGRMRAQAAAQFGGQLPPLPPGAIPQAARPQVQAIIAKALEDPEYGDRWTATDTPQEPGSTT
jgi:hypothetical protein